MSNFFSHRLTKSYRDVLALARSDHAFANATSIIVTVAILSLWLAGVIFTETRHEFFRDEVRALSLTRAAHSPLDLYGLIKYEGHPVLWYLLLYIGKSIIDTPLVLPVTSIIVVFAAVAVFMFFSPFPLWFRCLFIFSALPFYEYSVMARNYGISMLLLFIGAALYRTRAKHPLWLALVLALLANTNVHSTILASLILALWAWDIVAEQKPRAVQTKGLFSYLAPFLIVFAGLLLSAAFAMPRENTIVTSVTRSLTMREIAYSLREAVLWPEQTFSEIVPPTFAPAAAAALLYFPVFGLLHRPNLLLAALGGELALGVFFRVVYQGHYQHQGLFLVFLLFLYWLFIESSTKETMTRTKHLLFRTGFYAVVLILVIQIAKAEPMVWTDIHLEQSSSKAFGKFLNDSETYRDAIIVPEPDYLLESLPYYAKNRIYFSRERRFGTTVLFTTDADYRLSLGQLLSIARGIKTRYRQPVLIVLGHRDIDKQRSGEKRYSYNKVFSWTASDSMNFNESTTLIREFNSAYGDENYRVYSVR